MARAQPRRAHKAIPIEYGITRPMMKNSFLDAYFGEIVALSNDVVKAPGIKNKILYILCHRDGATPETTKWRI